MATWVRTGTGTAPTATNADLVGNYALDTATAPGDFDPAAVTSVRAQWTITGSGFSDDSWNNVAGCSLVTGATEISQHPGEGSTNNQNVVRSTDHTDSTGIPTGLSTAQWEAALVRGDGVSDAWCLWNKVKGADGSTLAASALTVTITYTPATPQPTIEVDAWRIYQDGAEASSTALGVANNQGAVVEFDTPFLVRFLAKNTGAGAATFQPKLQYRYMNPSTGAAVDWSPARGLPSSPTEITLAQMSDLTAASSHVNARASGTITDNAATTQRLGAGTFVAGKVDTGDGAFASSWSVPAGQETEVVFCVELDSTDFALVDDKKNQYEVQFRIVDDIGEALYDVYRNGTSALGEVFARVNPPWTWENDFEAGTAGNELANTDVNSPDGWDAVDQNTAANTLYSTTNPHVGTTHGRFIDVSGTLLTRIRWHDFNQGVQTFFRTYIYPISNGTQIINFLYATGGYNDGDSTCWNVDYNTDRTLTLQDKNGTTIGSTVALTNSPTEYYRLEIGWRPESNIGASDGFLELRLFEGDSTTAVSTITDTTALSGTEFEDLDFGPRRAADTMEMYIDMIAFSNDDWVGPATTNDKSGTASVTSTWSPSASGAKGGTGTAAASAVFSPTASGKKGGEGTASVSASFSPTASGKKGASGTASTAVAFTPSAAGDLSYDYDGTAAASVTFVPSAVGKRNAEGAASAAVAFTPTATGVLGYDGTVAQSVAFSPSASGKKSTEGAASASVVFSPTATGDKAVGLDKSGTASVSAVFSPTASGEKGGQGAASASATFSPTASGTASAAGSGSASVSVTFTPTASGAKGADDAASTSGTFVPSATGAKGAEGAASADATFTPAATGSLSYDYDGTASTSATFVPAATGYKSAESSASETFTIVTAAEGLHGGKGAASAAVVFTPTVTGDADTGGAEGSASENVTFVPTVTGASGRVAAPAEAVVFAAAVSGSKSTTSSPVTVPVVFEANLAGHRNFTGATRFSPMSWKTTTRREWRRM